MRADRPDQATRRALVRERSREFWGEAFAWRGSATGLVLPRVGTFGAVAAVVVVIGRYWPDVTMPVGPHEVAGAVLSLLLVLRSNAGYDRWWEARKLWGGIVNQTRNLAIQALSYGPEDPRWREQVVRWTVAFAHASRRSLRGERELPEVAALLGEPAAASIVAADHMPDAVARRLGGLLRQARDAGAMDGFAFHQAESERVRLIDHIGACERILKTPLVPLYSIKIRRFIVLFLVTLPFALLHRFETDWAVPIATMLVAYFVLSIDLIGAEIQNPFAPDHLGHLPLDDICRTIERNLLALLDEEPTTIGPAEANGFGPRAPAVESWPA